MAHWVEQLWVHPPQQCWHIAVRHSAQQQGWWAGARSHQGSTLVSLPAGRDPERQYHASQALPVGKKGLRLSPMSFSAPHSQLLDSTIHWKENCATHSSLPASGHEACHDLTQEDARRETWPAVTMIGNEVEAAAFLLPTYEAVRL